MQSNPYQSPNSEFEATAPQRSNSSCLETIFRTAMAGLAVATVPVVVSALFMPSRILVGIAIGMITVTIIANRIGQRF